MRALCLTSYYLYLLQIYYYRQDNKFIPATRFQELQYLDLDLECCDAGSSVASTTQTQKSPERVQPTSTVYKTVDFVKTVAFNRTRQEVEEVRKQCTAAADL
jgi:GRB2-associated-binding protein 1